jgi:hypothetical protein
VKLLRSACGEHGLTLVLAQDFFIAVWPTTHCLRAPASEVATCAERRIISWSKTIFDESYLLLVSCQSTEQCLRHSWKKRNRSEYGPNADPITCAQWWYRPLESKANIRGSVIGSKWSVKLNLGSSRLTAGNNRKKLRYSTWPMSLVVGVRRRKRQQQRVMW